MNFQKLTKQSLSPFDDKRRFENFSERKPWGRSLRF